jgi:hypothetical protein
MQPRNHEDTKRVFTNPPLCITETELREALAIVDRGLEITDKAVT